MEISINLPGDNRTQSAVAVVAYQYTVTKRDVRLIAEGEPILTGPTIMRMTLKQGAVIIRVNREKIIQIMNSIEPNSTHLKVVRVDGAAATLTTSDFEKVVEVIESIPPAWMKANAISEPINF